MFMAVRQDLTNYRGVYGRIVAVWPERANVKRGNEWISGEGRPFPLNYLDHSIACPAEHSVKPAPYVTDPLSDRVVL